MRTLRLGLALCLIARAALAQPAPSPTPQMTVATMPTATTYQGTIALSSGASTALTAANVTMATNSVGVSTVIPINFGKLFVLNSGSNLAYVCWFGGAASASSGCEALVAGASDTKNLNQSTAVPTFYSASGTTLTFSN